MITPAQFRAARALLGLSQEEVAAQAHVSKRTVVSLERGRPTLNATENAVMMALIEAGVLFTPAMTGEGPGVRFARDPEA
ncbi:helix-turn-helix transcriptional regulator [Methylobacterium sp. WL64]|uniref:helix-turn-helix transcriptional regulator n=1 Tax=Methylobacterium sp. WL64 TaxID=2603894 RepID=UPI00164F5ABB|nr:helix-turn-helix domain-containing protein [Methylobacterium sp. WL64]